MIEKGIDDINIAAINRITPPIALREQIPHPNKGLVTITRREIGDILHGRDPRLLMIVGPCSIHDLQAAADYAQRLEPLKRELENELVIVMRTYLEKPRTTVGWTGLAYDPNLDGSSDPNTGLTLSRQLLADTNKAGLPCAVEVLDPLTPQYIDDLVAWGAIGARTVESQTHRQLASGLSMPIGIKNSTEGDIKVAVDAMVAAQRPHSFYSIDIYGQVANVQTQGNPDTHIVLRGGKKGTNYDEVSIAEAARSIYDRGLLSESSHPVMVDCSHGNSNKDHRNQPGVIRSVLDRAQSRPYLMGFMIESNINEGRQDWAAGKELQYGVSITDACIGWEETARLLKEGARAIYPRRY